MSKKVQEKSEILTFEQALEQLEEIVKQLEKGDLPLEDALNQYAEGVKLANLCVNRLNDAENKVNQLVYEKDGVIEFRPLILEEEK